MRAVVPLTLALLLIVAAGKAGLSAPGDIVFERDAAGASVPPAVFSHWVHRIRYRCYVCHDALFKMERGANEITMKKINEGRGCGACHNGESAFPTNFQTCIRCHFEVKEE